MADFIDDLPIEPKERETLRELGVKLAYGALSLRKAAPADFDRQFAPGRGQAIADGLKPLLTPEESTRLDQSVRRGGSLGARLGPGPLRTTGDEPNDK